MHESVKHSQRLLTDYKARFIANPPEINISNANILPISPEEVQYAAAAIQNGRIELIKAAKRFVGSVFW